MSNTLNETNLNLFLEKYSEDKKCYVKSHCKEIDEKLDEFFLLCILKHGLNFTTYFKSQKTKYEIFQLGENNKINEKEQQLCFDLYNHNQSKTLLINFGFKVKDENLYFDQVFISNHGITLIDFINIKYKEDDGSHFTFEQNNVVHVFSPSTLFEVLKQCIELI